MISFFKLTRYFAVCALLLSVRLNASSTCILQLHNEPKEEITRRPCRAFKEGTLRIILGKVRATGAYSKVFNGRLINSDGREQSVVIKKIRLKTPTPQGYDEIMPGRLTESENTRAEFLRLESLYRHANLRDYIVKPYAYFEYDAEAYIVMEDAGEPLYNSYELMRQSPGALLSLSKTLFNAIRAIHSTGLIHLDLHPHNILINKAGQIKIIDFGFARPKGAKLSVAGSLSYRDPHIYALKYAYPAYDFFSYAAILYEIRFGHTIFSQVDSYENLEKIPIKPNNEKFAQYINVYDSIMEKCRNVETPCDRLTHLILLFLHPTLEKRTINKKGT